MIDLPSFSVAEYANGNPDAEKVSIVIPGRLDTKDYIHIRSHVDHLAKLGYYALSFDPPGTWESPGQIDLYTSTNMQLVIKELIAHLGSKPTTLVGHSRGGSHALLAGTTLPEVTHFAAIMSSVGPTIASKPAEGQVEHSTRDLPPGSIRTTDKIAFDLPYTYFEDQEQYDATELLKTCTKPKLFVAGSRDTTVPTTSIHATYVVSADPKEFAEIDAEHDYRLDPDAINEVNVLLERFLKTYETA